MTSNPYGPYALGHTGATMAVTKGLQSRKAKLISFKNSLSSDRRLQPADVKPESVVIVGQHTTVNTFSSLVLTIKAPGRLF